MSELERPVHVARENLRQEINRNRQKIGRSKKRLKERTDEHLAKYFPRMTREAEQRELRLWDYMEKLRIQHEQTLGTLDAKIVAMMERRTQAIMDRLDGLLGSRSGPNSRGPSREPSVNFNDQQNRRNTYGSTRGRGNSSAMPQGIIEHGAQTSEEVQLATDRPQTNDRRKAHMRLGEVIPGTGVMPAQEGVKRVKEETIRATRTEGKFQVQNPYQGAMILRRGIQEKLHRWPQPLNL